jgi:hypothetical protein
MKMIANFWMASDGSHGGDDIILFKFPDDMTDAEHEEVDDMINEEDFEGIVAWVKARNIPHAISVWNADAQEQELHIVPAK